MTGVTSYRPGPTFFGVLVFEIQKMRSELRPHDID
jgi:hypothetical protein